MSIFIRLIVAQLLAGRAKRRVHSAAIGDKITDEMRRFHLIFGSLLFIAFLVTGRFMRTDFPDKEAIDQELRILMRSRHIYILFSAFIHLILGAYLAAQPQKLPKLLQYIGSLLLTLSSILLVWAFVTETYQLQHFSDMSRYGIYTALAGTGIHLIGGLARKREED